MANTITQFQLIHFAQEGLLTLHDALGIARAVHRGFDKEPGFRGKTVRIGKPALATVNTFGTGAVDADTGGVDIVVDQHKEVHWKFTDSELFFSRQNVLLETHIRPAMKALAGDIDAYLAGLYDDIPWFVDVDETAANIRKNVTQPRKTLAANGVPVNDRGNMFLVIDEHEDARFRESTIFDFDKVGQVGANTQIAGSAGFYQGIEMIYSGKIKRHTSGTVVSAGTDVIGAVNNGAGYAAGIKTMAIDGLSLSETLVIGDSFSIAGHTQRYVLTANTTLSSGAGTISFEPGLEAAVADNAVVTFEDGSGAVNADSYNANMMFHRNAFALAMAPLEGDIASQQARAQGWMVEQIVDDETQLGLRAMLWYDGGGINLRMDALYGAVTLDRNRAVLLRGNDL